jgi:hypothetical protein
MNTFAAEYPDDVPDTSTLWPGSTRPELGRTQYSYTGNVRESLERAKLEDLWRCGLDLECNGLCIVIGDCQGTFNEGSEWS